MKKTTQAAPAEGFDVIYQNIRDILEKARYTAYNAINSSMVSAYWQIGRVIVEEEQKGKKRADYGETLIEELSKRLTRDYIKNFSERNLWHAKDFYISFPILNALRSELSWTHYHILLKVNEKKARDVYKVECRIDAAS
jgi:predicted GNAT family N-acyltransferase